MIDGHLARLTKTLETSGLNKSVSQMSNAVSAVKPTMEAINSINERMCIDMNRDDVIVMFIMLLIIIIGVIYSVYSDW